ncbi:monosaccharide ABC transporter ATP-binding protein (CUT2 family) [Palleronia aestuarii]|uniref:Monosaccharide ABC transporter ATP-binding protein (CUT2 family) n=1 Tax=Palleronia aestuarii TaxID=568105 RepID=A0A2W7N006_9RHOB|nr:ATP-binding cassette domain-containing protein [Palleronia aestuarii]PZX13745.1 monosaccharide ABC transporter ATP-binding protein (CUT2 family) [Palleronia aestuarii]
MTALLEVDGLNKRFGGNEAVKDVSFTVSPGECVVLAGDNGAGKSTVIKMISGVYTPTKGEVRFKGKRLTGSSPEAVRRAGIETIYQDLSLADNLDPGLNLYLGREKMKRVMGIPVLDRAGMRSDAAKVMKGLGIEVPDPKAAVRELSGGQRQAIAIARAIHWEAQLVIMDEPTAALGVPEQREVMALIERLKARNVGIILISHNLPDIFAAADRIIVLARGVVGGSRKPSETTDEEIVRLMMGAAA